MKLYRGNKIGPKRERWMKEYLRLEPIDITEEEIADLIEEHIDADCYWTGARGAAKDILSKLKGE